jgi:nucleotide-binding universal stress UspA family protein
VLEHAVQLGEAFGARYTLLQVVQPVGEYTLLGRDGRSVPFHLEERREQAAGYLAEVAARLRARGLDVETAVMAGANPARAIATFVAENQRGEARVDLIALETHGLGGAGHLFNAGVAEQVVHDSSIPVLVHHALGETVRVPAAVSSHERGLRLAPGPAAA